MNADRNVLVIEDDEDVAQLITLHLQDIGCSVTHLARGDDGLAEAQTGQYNLIVLDLMLPGCDGMEICRRMRTQASHTPILMLTAKASEVDRVGGLDAGADDYLTKPFSILEFTARVKAIFRRMALVQSQGEAAPAEDECVRLGGLVIDVAGRDVTLDGEPVHLTGREFDLLLYFARHPGRVYTRSQLLDAVWGQSHAGYEHTVNSHINRLRAKIEPEPSEPTRILTVWGAGYKMVDPGSESS